MIIGDIGQILAGLDNAGIGMGAARTFQPLMPARIIQLVIVAKQQVHILTGIIAAGRQDLGRRPQVGIAAANGHACGHLGQRSIPIGKPAIAVRDIDMDRLRRQLLRQQALQRGRQQVKTGGIVDRVIIVGAVMVRLVPSFFGRAFRRNRRKWPCYRIQIPPDHRDTVATTGLNLCIYRATPLFKIPAGILN